MRQTRELALLIVLPLVLLAAGCGSKKASAPTIQVLPNAETPEEWAGRIVNRLMRPLNRDLEVLAALNNPQTKFFILQGNKDTLDVLNRRMTDLGKCSDRLTTIGPPPQTAADTPQLNRVDGALHRACDHYVKVAGGVLDAVELMSSGRSDVIERGEEKLRQAGSDAGTAAKAYDEAVRVAQKLDEFRLQGLKPPA
jgi:hypothetical protein